MRSPPAPSTRPQNLYARPALSRGPSDSSAVNTTAGFSSRCSRTQPMPGDGTREPSSPVHGSRLADARARSARRESGRHAHATGRHRIARSHRRVDQVRGRSHRPQGHRLQVRPGDVIATRVVLRPPEPRPHPPQSDQEVCAGRYASTKGALRWPERQAGLTPPQVRPGPSRRRPRPPGPGRAAAACPGSSPRAS